MNVQDNSSKQPVVYQIRVQGQLDDLWLGSLNGIIAVKGSAADGSPVTTLTGPIVDQVALRGFLNKLWDLNLTLISVQQVPPGSRENARPPAQTRDRARPAPTNQRLAPASRRGVP